MSLPGRTRLAEPVSFPKSDDEWHSFLHPDFGPEEPVRAVIRLKRYLESKPEYKTVFSSKQLRREADIEGRATFHRLMKFLGSWKVPEYYNADGSWVDPNSDEKHRYAGAGVVCECGTPIVREEFGNSQEQPLAMADQSHADDCCKRWRVQARGRLWEERKKAIEEMTNYGFSIRQTQPRLGYEVSSDHGHKLAKFCGLDSEKLIREARERVVRSFIVLSREYSTDTVAELYDVSRGTVNRSLRNETNVNGKTLYSYRRRMAAE